MNINKWLFLMVFFQEKMARRRNAEISSHQKNACGFFLNFKNSHILTHYTVCKNVYRMHFFERVRI
jgi:hypothetical protein